MGKSIGKKNYSAVLRATTLGNGVYGVVKMGGQRGASKPVASICAEFKANPNFEDVVFYRDPKDLFFYGDEEDFQHNYRNFTTTRALFASLLEKWADGDGIAKIPISEMGLEKPQLDGIVDICDDTSLYLLQLPRKMARAEMPQVGTSAYASTVGHLMGLSRKLLELALANGHFFRPDAVKSNRLHPKSSDLAQSI